MYIIQLKISLQENQDQCTSFRGINITGSELEFLTGKHHIYQKNIASIVLWASVILSVTVTITLMNSNARITFRDIGFILNTISIKILQNNKDGSWKTEFLRQL